MISQNRNKEDHRNSVQSQSKNSIKIWDTIDIHITIYKYTYSIIITK